MELGRGPIITQSYPRVQSEYWIQFGNIDVVSRRRGKTVQGFEFTRYEYSDGSSNTVWDNETKHSMENMEN